MLLPEGPRREVALREAVLIVMEQPEPLMALRSARPGVLRQERAAAARPGVPAGPRRGAEARRRAHLSAAAARTVRSLQAEGAAMAAQQPAEAAVARQLVPPALQAAVAAAVREAQQALQVWGVRPTAVPGEVVAPGVVAGRQPVAELAEVAARPREAAAVQGVAEVVQRRAAAERAAAAVLPQAAVAAGRLPGAAPGAEEVPQQAARGEVPAVRPSAAAWVALPCLQEQARPAPSPRERSAHARKSLRIAQP